MYLLFLDESGTPPSKEKAEGKFFVIGGVIIHHEHFNEIYNKFEELKEKYNVNGEIKSVYFSMENTHKDNSLTHLSKEERNSLKRELQDIMTKNCQIDFISSVVDCEKYYNLYTNMKPNDIYHSAYSNVLELFSHFLIFNHVHRIKNEELVLKSEKYGMDFSDHRMKNEDAILRKHHHRLVDEYIIGFGRNNLILGSIHFIPSELSPFLQMADLFSGAVYQKFQRNDGRFLKGFSANLNRLNDLKSISIIPNLLDYKLFNILSSGGET